MGTQANNLLVRIDPKTGTATVIGPTGFPKLFGIAYAMGQVFGFTHNATGEVVTIDPVTGKGTLFQAFANPMGMGNLSFAGAGVNALVAPR